MKIVDKQQSTELLRDLVEKAWKSPEFKQQLINNPLKTISDVIGKELNGTIPNGKELVVVDQTDENKFYFNIPAKPNSDVELSEEQLEQVAGGVGDPFYDAGYAFGKWIQSLF